MRGMRVWIEDAGTGTCRHPIEIEKETFDLATVAALPGAGDGPAGGLAPGEDSVVPRGSATVAKVAGAYGEAWCLLGGPAGLRVNGERVLGGARILEDRDEIRLGELRLFLSSEGVAFEERYVASDRSVACPRCTVEIENDALVVRCPRCGLYHHHVSTPGAESADDPDAEDSCWWNDSVCAGCREQSTRLGHDGRWSPDAEGAS